MFIFADQISLMVTFFVEKINFLLFVLWNNLRCCLVFYFSLKSIKMVTSMIVRFSVFLEFVVYIYFRNMQIICYFYRNLKHNIKILQFLFPNTSVFHRLHHCSSNASQHSALGVKKYISDFWICSLLKYDNVQRDYVLNNGCCLLKDLKYSERCRWEFPIQLFFFIF